jgi:hypothetical protein
MKDIVRRNDFDRAAPADTRALRRIVVTAGMVLVGLILLAVAVYAGAFIMLAPMMQ